MGEAIRRDENALGRLWDAIVENTKDDDLFWIGEILLGEIEKETGFNPRKRFPYGASGTQSHRPIRVSSPET